MLKISRFGFSLLSFILFGISFIVLADDNDQKLRQLESACIAGDDNACDQFADGVKKKNGEKFKIYQDKDFVLKTIKIKRSCDNLATTFDDPNCQEAGLRMGILFEKSYEDIIKKGERICPKGNVNACNQAAYLYLYGYGVKKNLTKAKQYYGKACAFTTNSGGVRVGCNEYNQLNMLGY